MERYTIKFELRMNQEWYYINTEFIFINKKFLNLNVKVFLYVN